MLWILNVLQRNIITNYIVTWCNICTNNNFLHTPVLSYGLLLASTCNPVTPLNLKMMKLSGRYTCTLSVYYVHSPCIMYTLRVLCTLSVYYIHSPCIMYTLRVLCTLSVYYIHSPCIMYTLRVLYTLSVYYVHSAVIVWTMIQRTEKLCHMYVDAITTFSSLPPVPMVTI
jgi:hypothetical protein